MNTGERKKNESKITQIKYQTEQVKIKRFVLNVCNISIYRGIVGILHVFPCPFKCKYYNIKNLWWWVPRDGRKINGKHIMRTRQIRKPTKKHINTKNLREFIWKTIKRANNIPRSIRRIMTSWWWWWWFWWYRSGKVLLKKTRRCKI